MKKVQKEGEGIALSWDPPSFDGGEGVTSFTIYRGISSEGERIPIATVSSDIRTYRDEDLELGNYYFYSVTATNKRGESDHSPTLGIEYLNVPDPPTGFELSSGSRYVQLQWDPPLFDGGSALTGFNIYRSEGDDEMTLHTTRTSTSFDFNDTSLVNGLIYSYMVTALNKVGESLPTITLSAMPKGIPSAPRFLSVTSGDRFVSLGWDPPVSDEGDPVIGYNIYRGNTATSLLLYREIGTMNRFRDVNVTNGMEYHYSVSSFNTVGESSLSASVSAIPLGLPSAPRNVTIRGSPAYLDVSWSPPSDIGGSRLSGYKLYRGVDGVSPTPYSTLSGTIYEYRDVAVEGGKVYTYSVSAVTEVGESQRSGTASATHQDVCTRPQNIEGHTGDSFVLIRYDPPGNMRGSTLKGYQLFRGTTPSNARLLIKLGPEANEYNDTSVINGNTYHYHVIAVCDVWGVEKLSERSDMVSFSPKDPPVVKVRDPPSPPVNIRYSLLKDNVILSWDPPVHDGNSSVFRYYIYRSEDGGDMNYIGNTSVQTYTDMELLPGIAYRYSITALNIIGESDMSDTVEILLEEDPPAPPKVFPIWAIIIPVLILLIIVAAVGILLWRKRSPPPEDGSPPPRSPMTPQGPLP